jgi:DNA mismatch repair protein MutS
MTKISTMEEYLKTFQEYKLKYGEQSVVFFQIGMFYELYQNTEEGPLNKICKLLNIQMTKKNKNISQINSSNCLMAGVPIYTISKYIKILVENNYIVSIFDQLSKNGNITRKLKGVYSISINPISFDEIEDDIQSHILTCLFVKDNIISLLHLDNSINSINITEKYNQTTSEIINLIISLNSSEYNIYTNDKELLSEINKLKDEENTNINIISDNDVPKEYFKIDYQNDLLNIFYSHLTFGILSPIEYLNLEYYPTSVTNLLYTISFIKNHDTLFIKNLNIPIINNEMNYLNIALDTLDQLNVLPNQKNKHRFNSLFNVINYTNTVIGKRKLLNLLKKPFKNKDIISLHYEMSNVLINTSREFIKEIKLLLEKISDFEKLHRKMGLLIITPSEFYKLHCSYINIYELLILIKKNNLNEKLNQLVFNDIDINLFNDYIRIYHDTFKLDVLITEDNFFKNNLVLNTLQNDINKCNQDMDIIRDKFNNLFDQKGDFIKLLSDNASYYLLTTKIRFEALKKKYDVKDLVIKTNKNEIRFYTKELLVLSDKIIDLKNSLNTQKKQVFLQTMAQFYDQYNPLFLKMVDFIGVLDLLLCNVHLFYKYKYTCPIILNQDTSAISYENLRHPIIERVLQTNYITNDISLNDENNIILYGFNSSGKSSLLRAIGLNIILAQCGLFVSASKMQYAIFHNLICQVDLTDNFFKNCSSFITELKGIKYILNNSNCNTLVLADEMSKGSECTSATALFAATVNSLINLKVKFLFTTHLHGLADLNIIKKNTNIKICHLDVLIENDIVYFKRKIKQGKINELYGIEIASTILEKDFIDTTYKIREELVNNLENTTIKKSRYNTKKLLIKCEICNYQPKTKKDFPLETHHIIDQCLSDDNGFYKDQFFHKNEKYNLVSLCKECHLSVTLKKIVINGYIQTSNGIVLDYH